MAPWNMQANNFIESIMVIVDFLFDKKAIIIMHVDDLQVLKDIHSFLENYQLKVHMKSIIVNSSPQMSSEDTSFQVPWISLYPYVSTFYILLKLGLTWILPFSCRLL